MFITCPSCEHIAFECDEAGHMWRFNGTSIGSEFTSGHPCICGSSKIEDFVLANSQQLSVAGISKELYE
jgi:hypothetical protein